MKTLTTLAALLVCAAPTMAQTGGKVNWACLEGEPGWIGLWHGDTYLGKLDPFEGDWVFRNAKEKVNVRAHTFKHNPPRTPAGALPQGGRSATPKAGVKDDFEAPAPKESAAPKDDKPKAGGVCECDTCKCKDGHKAKDCGCSDCRCADVNGGKGHKPDNGPPRYLFGVERDRLVKGAEKYTLSGREAGRAEALSALEAAGDIPNDANLTRLTVIGSEAARRQVLADLKGSPDLAFWRDKLVVKDYPADHWRVKDGGFVAPKEPSAPVIYVQKADGTVLWRQDDYRGGAPELSKALRDRVPGYDPAKDPQPRVAPPVGTAGGFGMGWLLVSLAGVAAYLVGRWRGK
ncbi:MAG TPA: hypothetical protein VEI97_08140 [bacterium]|nr:hypothetical protein [bacterium]